MTAADRLRRRLAQVGSGTGRESSAAEADLGQVRREASLDALSDLVRRSAPEPGAQDPAEGIVDVARAGFEALQSGARELPAAMQVALEAVVLSDGSRPAVLVQDDRVDPLDPTLGDWREDVLGAGPLLRTIARGTGRVTLEHPGGLRSVGTAFAVGTGVVVTNRHVLQEIAETSACGQWTLRPGCTIDFRAEHDRPACASRIFAPDRVVFAGAEPIGDTVDAARLDVALIALAPNGLADLPESLPLSDSPEQAKHGTRVAALGYPAEPARGLLADQVLFRLFRGIFGVKRFAPGRISSAPGHVAQDVDPPRVFGHDASTLGGNSGSCIVALDGTWDVVGLHFGGRQQIENFAHVIARIRQEFA